MQGVPYHNKYQKDPTTQSPNKGEVTEVDKKCQKKDPYTLENLVEPIVFEPKHKIRLSRLTYKVNSYIDFGPYHESFKKFESYLERVS